MLTLSGAQRRGEMGGEPLPQIFPSLAPWKALFRRQEFSMIAAQSGVGKSTIALWMGIQWVRRHGLKGLYFSADSGALTQASRALAMLTGVSFEQAEEWLETNDSATGELEKIAGLEFAFEPEIRLLDVELEIAAFVEKWGQTPDFIIFDNLFDVETDSENEWTALREATVTLTGIARRTDAAVLALHHCTDGEYKSTCPPLSHVMGKPSIKQALIMTMGNWTATSIPVAVVKSRFGPQDKSGNSAVYLPFDPDTMQFGE